MQSQPPPLPASQAAVQQLLLTLLFSPELHGGQAARAMSKKNLTEEDIATLIETEEGWAKISGDGCEHDKLHVVELFSPWCGSSEAINSTYKRLAIEYKGRKVSFFKVRAPPYCPSKPSRRLTFTFGVTIAFACLANTPLQMESKLISTPEFEKISLSSKPYFALFKEGEQIEQVEGINTPLLEKLIGDNIPEGIIEIDDEPAEGEEEDA